MVNILLKEIDSSIYNIEIILRLLDNKRLTAYSLARRSGKELQQANFRKACDFLNKKGILITEEINKSKYHKLDYKNLVDLFFNCFQEKLKMAPTENEYSIYGKFFASKTCFNLAKRIIEKEIKKGSMEEFFHSTYAFIQFIYMFDGFLSRINKVIQQSTPIKINKRRLPEVTRILGNMSKIGIYIDEMEGLIPELIKTHASLFKDEPYFEKVKEIFKLDQT